MYISGGISNLKYFVIKILDLEFKKLGMNLNNNMFLYRKSTKKRSTYSPTVASRYEILPQRAQEITHFNLIYRIKWNM